MKTTYRKPYRLLEQCPDVRGRSLFPEDLPRPNPLHLQGKHTPKTDGHVVVVVVGGGAG